MDFYEHLERDCNSGINIAEYETIVLVDFNTNILKSDNTLIYALNNFMQLCGLKQLTDIPTRTTDTFSSILDLIMVSDCNKISQSVVLDLGVSDHMLIYCT